MNNHPSKEEAVNEIVGEFFSEINKISAKLSSNSKKELKRFRDDYVETDRTDSRLIVQSMYNFFIHQVIKYNAEKHPSSETKFFKTPGILSVVKVTENMMNEAIDHLNDEPSKHHLTRHVGLTLQKLMPHVDYLKEIGVTMLEGNSMQSAFSKIQLSDQSHKSKGFNMSDLE